MPGVEIRICPEPTTLAGRCGQTWADGPTDWIRLRLNVPPHPNQTEDESPSGQAERAEPPTQPATQVQVCRWWPLPRRCKLAAAVALLGLHLVPALRLLAFVCCVGLLLGRRARDFDFQLPLHHDFNPPPLPESPPNQPSAARHNPAQHNTKEVPTLTRPRPGTFSRFPPGPAVCHASCTSLFSTLPPKSPPVPPCCCC